MRSSRLNQSEPAKRLSADARALAEIVPPETDLEPLLGMVRPASNPRFGDYQSNCAKALAGRLRRSADEVAEEIVDQLDLSGFCLPAEIAADLQVGNRPARYFAQLILAVEKLFVTTGTGREEVGKRHIQAIENLFEKPHRRIGSALFDQRNRRIRDAGEAGQPPLRQPVCSTQRLQSEANVLHDRFPC